MNLILWLSHTVSCSLVFHLIDGKCLVLVYVIFTVNIQENMEDDLVKQALLKVGYHGQFDVTLIFSHSAD